MATLEYHGQRTNTEGHLRCAGRPPGQLGCVACFLAEPGLPPFDAVPPMRFLEPPPRKGRVGRDTPQEHKEQDEREAPSDERMRPERARRSAKRRVEHWDVEEEPQGEAKLLEDGVGDIDYPDDLPGEVYTERDQGHGRVSCLE